jgi:hypothetical protein
MLVGVHLELHAILAIHPGDQSSALVVVDTPKYSKLFRDSHQ